MAGEATMRMRTLSSIVIGAWVLLALATIGMMQLGWATAAASAACLAVGYGTAGPIVFVEVPIGRLWILLGLPLSLSAYAGVAALLGRFSGASWSFIALSYIVGTRAANLRQMRKQGS